MLYSAPYFILDFESSFLSKDVVQQTDYIIERMFYTVT